MILRINQGHKEFEDNHLGFIKSFSTSGKDYAIGKRNHIKIFVLNDNIVSVKSFKTPILINQLAYKYFRKSKARRSFEYASILLKKNISTPKPIGYAEFYTPIGLGKSYYISEHFDADLTYNDLILDKSYPDRENIIRQFTRFTFDLHQKGIEFRDHSSTNTLIKKRGDNQYQFLLVDLNRMNFKKSMGFNSRMKNFCRLTQDKKMIEIMSNEYAKFYMVKSEIVIMNKMFFFNVKYHLKLENKLKIKRFFRFFFSF
jgi:hypothetical protein